LKRLFCGHRFHPFPVVLEFLRDQPRRSVQK